MWYLKAYLRIALLTVVVMFPGLRTARADQYDDLSKQYAFGANNAWEQVIKPKFMSVMPASEKAVLNSIDFRFMPGGGSFDAFAATLRGQRIILISGAFVAFMDVALDALIVSKHFGIYEQFLPYLDYANSKGLENVVRWRAHQPLQLIPYFCAYAHINPHEAAAFMNSEIYRSEISWLRVHSLAYVIGHEIGHHVHNDHGSATDAEQREREIAADRYSLRLTLKAGFSPLPAIAVMLFFHEMGGDSRHPRPLCRAFAFATRGYPPLLRDPQFKAYMDARPEFLKTFNDLQSFLKTYKTEIESECGEWVYPHR